MQKALMITWERFQDHEVIYPYYSLKEHNFNVLVAANKIGRINGDLGAFIESDGLVSAFVDQKVRDEFLEYDLLVIPGGVKSLEKLRQEKGVLEFVRQWNIKNKTIFVVCNGAQLLISSKILKGRTLTGYYSIQTDIENAGAIYPKENVYVDGNIVSCNHYNYMSEWLRVGYKHHKSR